MYLALRVGTDNPRSTRIFQWNGTGWDLFLIALEGGGYMTSPTIGDGVIYVTGDFTQPWTDSGYPRCLSSIIKSEDGGTTWTDLAGRDAPLPLSHRTWGTRVFPKGSYNATLVAVDGDNNPVVLANYLGPDSEYGELWQATWDGEVMVHRKVLDHPADAGIGDVQLISHNGTLIATVGELDTISDPVEGPQAPYPTGKLWMLVSTDNAASWTRYELHDADETHGYSGAFLDPRSLAVDGVVRMLPTDLVTPSTHEVWELTLP